MVQKSSWKYHKLNISQSEGERVCRRRRHICDNSQTPINGLRLKNRKSGQVVEVNVDGSWGTLCDDTFNMVTANMVCKQMGYHLGAKEVSITITFRKHDFHLGVPLGDKGSRQG